jgi:predicted nucleotidyltransferase
MIQKLREKKEEHLAQLKQEYSRVKKELIELGVLKIIKFGSSVRGELGVFSDIDLLIIMESENTFVERLANIYEKIQPKEIDILAYTPDEFQRMKEENLFIQHILKEGIKVYERDK